MKTWKLLAVPMLFSLGSMQAQADFITLDLSSIVDSDLTGYTNGDNYPAPGAIAIDAIPFAMTAGPNGKTWVVGGLAALSNPTSYHIGGLNVEGATAMYALINSAFGSCDPFTNTIGTIGAGTGSGTSTFKVVEGINSRDHYSASGFCQTAPDAIATADYAGDVRFDVYRFDLSALTAGGANAITDFNFQTLGAGLLGEPFVAAITFATVPVVPVPEPGTLVLLSLGLGVVGLARRRRS